MPLTCPNRECGYTGPVVRFDLEYKEYDVYRCDVCEREFLTTTGGDPPIHHNQPTRPVAKREIDFAKCPKCKRLAHVESVLTSWPAP
jgi:ribosomal protein L37AE/L43A